MVVIWEKNMVKPIWVRNRLIHIGTLWEKPGPEDICSQYGLTHVHGYHMGKSWAQFVKVQYGLARMGTMCDNPDFFFGGGGWPISLPKIKTQNKGNC